MNPPPGERCVYGKPWPTKEAPGCVWPPDRTVALNSSRPDDRRASVRRTPVITLKSLLCWLPLMWTSPALTDWPIAVVICIQGFDGWLCTTGKPWFGLSRRLHSFCWHVSRNVHLHELEDRWILIAPPPLPNQNKESHVCASAVVRGHWKEHITPKMVFLGIALRVKLFNY